jgi:hypothetical protein
VKSQCEQIYKTRSPRKWWFWLSMMCRWLPTANRKNLANARRDLCPPCRLCTAGEADNNDHAFSCAFGHEDLDRLCVSMHQLQIKHAVDIPFTWRSERKDYPVNAIVPYLLQGLLPLDCHGEDARVKLAQVFLAHWQGKNPPSRDRFREALGAVDPGKGVLRDQVCTQCPRIDLVRSLTTSLHLSTTWGDSAWSRATEEDPHPHWLSTSATDTAFGATLISRVGAIWTEEAVHAARGKWILGVVDSKEELFTILALADAATQTDAPTRFAIVCTTEAACSVSWRRVAAHLRPKKDACTCPWSRAERWLLIVENAHAAISAPAQTIPQAEGWEITTSDGWQTEHEEGRIGIANARGRGHWSSALSTHAALHWFDPREKRTWNYTIPATTSARKRKSGAPLSEGDTEALTRVANHDRIGGLAGCVPVMVVDLIFPPSETITDADSKEYWLRRSTFVREAQLLTLDCAMTIWYRRQDALRALDKRLGTPK